MEDNKPHSASRSMEDTELHDSVSRDESVSNNQNNHAEILTGNLQVESSDNDSDVGEGHASSPRRRRTHHSSTDGKKNSKTQHHHRHHHHHHHHSRSHKSRPAEPAEHIEVLLNPYALIPRTIPPFAVVDELSIQAELALLGKIRDGKATSGKKDHTANDIHEVLHNTSMDPFLNSNEGEWGVFLTNVGSHTSYAKNQVKSATISKHNLYNLKEEHDPSHGHEENQNQSYENSSHNGLPTTINDVQDGHSTESGSIGTIFTDKNSSLKNDDGEDNFFADLNGSWGGRERLNAVLITPGLNQQNFKSAKEKQEFNTNLRKLKDVYYSPHNKTEGIKINNKDKVVLYFKQQYGVKKRKLVPLLKRILFDDRCVPLILRLFITGLCLIALGIAGRIFENCKEDIPETTYKINQQPSTIMALTVNSIAIVYVLYIAYDEFHGEPVGLRDPLGKLKLILLDLLFLMFSSANLALSFNSLYASDWVCTGGEPAKGVTPKLDYLCRKQKSLSSFLFIILFFWVLTFTISIVRVVIKSGNYNYSHRDRNRV